MAPSGGCYPPGPPDTARFEDSFLEVLYMKKRIFVMAAALLCLSSTLVFARGGNQSGAGALPTVDWWLVSDAPPNIEAGQKAINDYIGPKIGVNVEFKWFSWADVGTRQNAMLNSGEYWDIWSWLGVNYYDWARRGFLADITDLLPNYPGLTTAVPQALWDGFKVNGRVYAVPTYKDSASTWFSVWDESMVKKYNIDITNLKTIADFDKVFRTVKAGEGARYYPVLSAKGAPNGYFQYTLLGYDTSFGLDTIGVKFTDPAAKVTNLLEDPAYLDMARYFRRWYQDGLTNPDAPLIDNIPLGQLLYLSQGWPSAYVGNWAASRGLQSAVAYKLKEPAYTTESILNFNTISANSKNKEASLKFLELLNTDQKLRDMLAYGVEGKDFQYVAPTVVRKLTDTWNIPHFETGTFFIISTVENEGDPWAEVLQQNESATRSAILGFAFDRTPVQNEFANCTTIWDRFNVDIKTGAVDPDVAIPQALAELRANGYDRIIAEAQRQVDAWLRTK
jgi:putative aldouronate transport system substrate-binding protein